MVVHNGHAFPRNYHFPGDRMVKYYIGDEWKAINKALQGGPQAVWLIGTGYNHKAIVDTLEEGHTVSQFVLKDGRTFRTWKKHTDTIKICKELFDDTVDWQFQEGMISEEKRVVLLESLKVVDLAEQVFGANYARGKLANEIND